MKIAVVGLGIIGGSYCKAIKAYTPHTVIGINRTKSVAEKALAEGRRASILLRKTENTSALTL